MASVFLPAIVGRFLTDENIPVVDLLNESLAFTQKWMTHESNRITDPEGWNPQEPALDPRPRRGAARVGKWVSLNWTDTVMEWEQAYGKSRATDSEPRPADAGWGVIGNTSEMRIELWRAMTDLEGYVCLVESKRRVVRELVTAFNRFRRGEAAEHVSCMVISEPGAGKTFLAQQLAKSLDMHYLPFNITQMLSKQDLITCFDRIATTAQSSDKRVLVFIDEINAQLSAESVYGAFLAPLEEKVFIQNGQPHPIQSCGWLFAGTKDPREEPKESKGPDFYSRLTVKPLTLRVETSEEDRARLENVYLGVSLIRATYADVRFVSEKIVKMFHGIRTTTSGREEAAAVCVRDIEQFVRLLDEVQYGQVRDRNVRSDVIAGIGNRFGIVAAAWKREKDGALIKIVG
jgi:hypothetical protein